MPRRKMTEEEKRERDRKKEEKRREENLAADLERHKYDYARQHQFGPPTRTYNIGDLVRFGSHPNAEVIARDEDGPFYLIRCWGEHRVYHDMVKYEDKHWVTWYEILPEKAVDSSRPIFSFEDDVHLHFMQQDIQSLIAYHNRGIDYDTDYQRGVAWTMTQRLALMESIFQNVDIGKFTLIDRGYLPEGPMMEVLDGKQRLQTIVAFFQDRFPFRGRLYSELHNRDRYHFRGYSVSVSVNNGLMTPEQKYRYFLKLNTGGEPQDPRHIAKVEALWKKALAEQENK